MAALIAATEFHPSDLQLQAIEHVHGPLEVLAGHGTGKTAVLTHRHARLILERVAWKYDILSLTFTRQAAMEMLERVQLLLDEDVENLPIRTIHAQARLLLLGESTGEAEQKPFRVYDERQAFRTLRKAMQLADVSEKVWPLRVVAAEIDAAKERGIDAADYLDVPDSPGQQAIARVYTKYQELLKAANAYDFSDLILAAIRILESKPELREQIHAQHRFIQVDEWQDTSTSQYRFIRLLTGPDANLFVVGSESQAIYGWRRANYKRLAERFYRDFPQAQQLVLKENWRSVQPIVTAARALFNGQYRDVDLIAMRGEGDPIQRVRVDSEYDESAFVAREARRLNQAGISWSDMAVLYRVSAQSALIEQDLLGRGIPYVMTHGHSLYDRREVRDVLAYLEYAASGSELALGQIINTPPRGLGPVTLRRIKDGDHALTLAHLMNAAMEEVQGLKPETAKVVEMFLDVLFDLGSKVKETPPPEMIEYVLAQTGYEAWLAQEFDWNKRVRTLGHLKQDAAQHANVADFLEAVQQKSTWQNEHLDEGVTLSTIHSSKGRQWAVVFVIGVEEGLLPHVKAAGGGRPGTPDPPEERRLAHVAISRACSQLYLLYAATREKNGRRVDVRASRYLMRLPPEIVERR